MKSLVWLSFDLGVRGDFEGMYQFLDSHGAKECGDSVGAFHFDYKNDLIAELTKSMKEYVTFNKRSRVYVIYQKDGKIHRPVYRWKAEIPPLDRVFGLERGQRGGGCR